MNSSFTSESCHPVSSLGHVTSFAAFSKPSWLHNYICVALELADILSTQAELEGRQSSCVARSQNSGLSPLQVHLTQLHQTTGDNLPTVLAWNMDWKGICLSLKVQKSHGSSSAWGKKALDPCVYTSSNNWVVTYVSTTILG